MRSLNPRAVPAKHKTRNHCQFEVDSSVKQDLIIKIRKFKDNTPKNLPIASLLKDNPYVVAKKSYAGPRESRLDRTYSPEPFEKPSCKKKTTPECMEIVLPREVIYPKKSGQPLLVELVNCKTYFDRSYFQTFLETPEDFEVEKSFFGIHLSRPLVQSTDSQLQVNEKVVSNIEIVTNENKKINVNIHKALIQANNPPKVEGKTFLEGVSNPFNLEFRNDTIKMVNFIKDYRSGYAPIELQSMNEDKNLEKVMESAENSGKNHFIRKKQSTLSLSRTCGVSYIKPSESSQGPPFFPLPPLIFQCSSECDLEIPSTPELTELTSSWTQHLWNNWLLMVECEEVDMRHLLLGKSLGKIILVKGIHNLWPLITEKEFLVIAVTTPWTSSDTLWRQFHQAEIKIGILGKKSTSGKKSFFKSVGLEALDKQSCSVSVETTTLASAPDIKEQGAMEIEADSTKLSMEVSNSLDIKKIEETEGEECAQYLREIAKSRSVLTLSIRLELYVQMEKWKRYSKETKNILNYLILYTKERLEVKSLQIIQRRLQLAKSTDMNEALAKELVHFRIPNCEPPIQTTNLLDPQIIDVTAISNILTLSNSLKDQHQQMLLPLTHEMSVTEFLKGRSISNIEKAMFLKTPLYYISTRDSFAFDLVEKTDYFTSGDRSYTRTEYFFDPCNLPGNYSKEFQKLFPNNDVGIITYNNFFTNDELKHFEERTFETELKALKNNFLQMTVQPTITGTKIKRSKFFFGYRYMWTKCQLAEPNSYVGAGVRKDVTQPPSWIKDIENPLVQHGIVEKDFINSVAINVYHDGKEGLAQHFDDAVRFKQPIYTLRLFSDARLSFGSQLYGFCNSAFVIPLPRGCICVMTQHSYAANGVKHCVRPVDMAGKSAAVILRQMHSLVTTEVDKYDQLVDFPLWVSTLSAGNDSVSFAEQKRREAEFIMDKKQTKIKS